MALDGAKGALIFLVVLGHTLQFAVMGRHGDPLDDALFTAIYSFHMPAFMALAGWLAQPGLSRHDGRWRMAARRCLSYLIPILTATLLTELLWSSPGLRTSGYAACPTWAGVVWSRCGSAGPWPVAP